MFRYRGLAVLAVLVVLCCACVMPAAADVYHEVETVEELRNVITWSNNPSNASNPFLVVVKDNIGFDGSAWLPEISGNITLTTVDSAGKKIYRTAANTTAYTGMFMIGDGGNLTIRANVSHLLTLDGNNTNEGIGSANTQPLIKVDFGNFTLENGILMNNTCMYSSQSNFASAGGVSVGNSGTFTMSGGIIKNCIAKSESSSAHGGGVYLNNGVTFTMSGGTIENCRAESASGEALGGGVFIYSGELFLEGGIIKNCIAKSVSGRAMGGGVYGPFTMSGGAIENCRAESDSGDALGGGVYVLGGWLEMDGGKIFGNSAAKGAEVYVERASIDPEGSAQGWFAIGPDAYVGPGDTYLAGGDTWILSTSGPSASPKIVENIVSDVRDTGRIIVKLGDWTYLQSSLNYFSLGPSMTGKILEYAEISTPEIPDVSEEGTMRCLRLADKPSPIPPSPSTEGDGNMNNAFRVLFDTQGGSFVPPATDLSYGDRVAKPADPEKSTLSFAGWYTDAACSTLWDFTAGIPGDMTLYAGWIGSTTPTQEPSVPQTPAPPVTTAPPVSSPPTTIPTTGDATITPPADTSDDDKPGSGALYLLLLLLFLILLFLILLLRHTVTFLVTTADGIKKYRVGIWHGRKIDPETLPALLRTAAWYLDEDRTDRWDMDEDRVIRNIRLYHG